MANVAYTEGALYDNPDDFFDLNCLDQEGGSSSEGEDEQDLENYKGIHFNDEKEKYFDPNNGAHFEFGDICSRLSNVVEERKSKEREVHQRKERQGHTASSSKKYQLKPKEIADKKPVNAWTAETQENAHPRRELAPEEKEKIDLLTEKLRKIAVQRNKSTSKAETEVGPMSDKMKAQQNQQYLNLIASQQRSRSNDRALSQAA